MVSETELTNRRRLYQLKLKEWRRKSPFRAWRKRVGYDINTAAFLLKVPFSTYQKWDYGNAHPRIQTRKDGRLFAMINVREKPEQELVQKDWDEYLVPRTGVSINQFITWYNRRPTP